MPGLIIATAYYARTFNFLITPSFTGNSSVDHQLAQFLDRYVGFSQRSVMFLRDHGFQMDRAFKDGVSYLSRTEILELNKRFLRPHSSVSDAIGPTDRVVLADHGQEAIEFHIYAYGLINAWFTNRSYNVRSSSAEQPFDADQLTELETLVCEYHESTWRQTEPPSSAYYHGAC